MSVEQEEGGGVELELEEHVKVTLGERSLVLRSMGRSASATLRLEYEGVAVEWTRAEWREVHRVLGRLLAPLPEPPASPSTTAGRRGAGPQPVRQGKPWTAEEDDRLRAAWLDDGATLEELVEEHGRSLGGILSRLVRLEIVESRKDARAEGVRRRG